MTVLSDLPIDLLPLIVQHIPKPSHLTQVCLVNKLFYSNAIRLLYGNIVIYAWHRNAKSKVSKLFATLANVPRLAFFVTRLELRVFPKYLPSDAYDQLISLCLNGLRNCVNLQSCTWTRDGTLSSVIIEAFRKLPRLESLEINGRSEGNYDPALLTRITKLKRLSVIMPSQQVSDLFSTWFRHTGSTLVKLTLVCKATPHITDETLKEWAPHLANLERLHLAGCTKVTHRGILALLAANVNGICALGLEGLSSSFDMSQFGEDCRALNALRRLKSITLTCPLYGLRSSWLSSVETLLWDAPLTCFRLYTSGNRLAHYADMPEGLPTTFVRNLVSRHGHRLTQFAVMRTCVGIEILDTICRNCANLQQLFVAMRKRDLKQLGPIVIRAKNIRSIHVTYHSFGLDVADHECLIPLQEELLDIIRQCGGTLRQFGVQSRYWQVERTPIRDSEGRFEIQIQLDPHERPDVPEAFLVVWM